MNQHEFDKIVEETVVSIKELLNVKGGEYAGSEDRLANFKRGARLSGCTPLQVALIYLAKHYDAVGTYVRDGASGTERRRSEGISGRLDDLINYCILMKALVQEEKGSVPTPIPDCAKNAYPAVYPVPCHTPAELAIPPWLRKD